MSRSSVASRPSSAASKAFLAFEARAVPVMRRARRAAVRCRRARRAAVELHRSRGRVCHRTRRATAFRLGAGPAARSARRIGAPPRLRRHGRRARRALAHSPRARRALRRRAAAARQCRLVRPRPAAAVRRRIRSPICARSEPRGFSSRSLPAGSRRAPSHVHAAPACRPRNMPVRSQR